MQRSVERILTTHVGSLVRTADIVEVHIQQALGEPVDAARYEEALRSGVTECVNHQAKIGVDIEDRGRYHRRRRVRQAELDCLRQRTLGWHGPTGEKTDFDAEAASWPEQRRHADFYRAYVRHESADWLPDAPSRGRYSGGAATEYTNVVCRGPLAYKPEAVIRDIRKLRQALVGVKVTEVFMPVVAPGSIELVRNEYYATQEEYLLALAQELSKEYRQIVDAGFVLQVDDAILPMMYSWRFRHRPFAEYLAWAELRIEALNRALKGIPEDQVRYHICFGSHNMPHTSDPSLRDLVALVLRVHAQIQWAKLESLVEGARIASRQLWGGGRL
jgi:5-methyltetrahydropteroyltriglutamate--homocysteine methyltransferase